MPIPTIRYLIDPSLLGNRKGKRHPDEGASSVQAKGRFGDESVEMVQSVNSYRVDYQHREDWRGSRDEDCIANTWLEGPEDLIQDTHRGEIAIGCADMELAGARAHLMPFQSVTTNLNRLRRDKAFVYAGIVENPSAARGVKDGPRSSNGDTTGTMVYAGGAVSIAMNSPYGAYSGQHLYLILEPRVAYQGGKLVGNYFKFFGYKRTANGELPKLFPQVVALQIAQIEGLQGGVLVRHLHHLEEILEPGSMNTDAIDLFSKTVENHLQSLRLNMSAEIEHWALLWLLHEGLKMAYFVLTGYHDATSKSGPAEHAVKSLYRQLGVRMQLFVKWQIYKAGSRTIGAAADGTKLCISNLPTRSTPINLTTDHYTKLDTGIGKLSGAYETRADPNKWNLAAKAILDLLHVAAMGVSTAHNEVVNFIRSRWIGGVISGRAVPGGQVRCLSRS